MIAVIKVHSLDIQWTTKKSNLSLTVVFHSCMGRIVQCMLTRITSFILCVFDIVIKNFFFTSSFQGNLFGEMGVQVQCTQW